MQKEITTKRYGFLNDPYQFAVSNEEKQQIRRYRQQIKKLTLNPAEIMYKEQNREAVEAPIWMMALYHSICWGLDVVFMEHPIDRFWFLETVARMPYFSYVAILHMYETLGFWEIGSELKKIHAEQEENEMYHLKIMQSLGGDIRWWNRFLSKHTSIVYYLVLLLLFMISPKTAYLTSELLEMHAVDTYSQFIEENEFVLKSMCLTESMSDYNDESENAYDIFKLIRDDELEHAKNMSVLRQ